jgi:L-alanine-DL-glutamate epimerase-like enolase superfamily enzyme
MKIVKVSAIPMSAPVPEEKRHRTDLGTKVKSDATLIRVATDSGLTGIGAALGTPPIVAAIIEHELAAECVDEDPLFSERIYEKMYNGSRSRPALERGITQADESRRRGVIMEAIAGVDIAVWDVKRLTENELSDFSQLWHDGCVEAIIEAQDVDRNHSAEV